MATATKTHTGVKYTLELTEEEAQTLLDVTENIGGDPSHTRRKHTDSISVALIEAGVCSEIDDIKSSLYFKR